MAARISGISVAMVAGGFVLLWSGLRNVSIHDTLTGFASGTVPQGSPTGPPAVGLTPPAGTTASSSTVPAGSGGSAGHVRTVGGTASQTNWSKSLLLSLGMPQTQANIASINAWQQREGGGGAHNPLNTTWPEPGASNFNSVGVKNYTSEVQGLAATVATLRGGGYNDILMYLRSGKGFLGVSLAGLSRWSGGGYSSVG